MTPEQQAAVNAWLGAKLGASTPTERASFLSYLVGTALTANPPLSAQTVINDVVSGLPAEIFGVFYQLSQLEPLPTAGS